MEERNIANMITSIIAIGIVIASLILGLIYNNTISIVMISIFYSSMLIHYGLKSIYYAKEESTSKEVVGRISSAFLDLTTTLITISFVLILKTPYNWIIFGIPCSLGVMEILSDSINKWLPAKYYLTAIKILLLIIIILYLYKTSIATGIGISSILIAYSSILLGKLFHDKIITSFELLAVTLFGIFIIFI